MKYLKKFNESFEKINFKYKIDKNFYKKSQFNYEQYRCFIEYNSELYLIGEVRRTEDGKGHNNGWLSYLEIDKFIRNKCPKALGKYDVIDIKDNTILKIINDEMSMEYISPNLMDDDNLSKKDVIKNIFYNF